jgi:ATP-dependent 26S proteasome regulatory subunit
MGCNCKNKRENIKTTVINNETIITPEKMTLETMIGDEKPPFTRQEVQRAIDYINGITTSYNEKLYVYEFHNKYHREQLKPSCSVCLPRIQARMNDMMTILKKYEEKL